MKKTTQILTALILSLPLLSGCASRVSESETFSTHSAAPAQEARQKAYPKTVTLMFDQKKDEEGNIRVNILLDNPKREPITSVQTWLAYNSNLLEGIRFDVSESDFSLAAPYENGFDNQTGLFRLGRSVAGSTNKKLLKVAEVVFRPLKPGTAMVEAYDYNNDPSLGHISANIVKNGVPVNVLKAPKIPAVIIKTN